MDINEKFAFTSKYGTHYPVAMFVVDRYASNGNLYLGIQTYDEEEEYWDPYCDCTVNAGWEFDDDTIAVKNYSENEGVEDILKNLGIIEAYPFTSVSSGYARINVFHLTESGKELFKDLPKEVRR